MAKNTIYKGNTINNFGRHMPCPYVDKIELYDVTDDDLDEASEILGFTVNSGDASKIRVHMSFLLHAAEDIDLMEYMTMLYEDLYLSLFLITDPAQRDLLMDSRRNLKDVLRSMYTFAGHTPPDSDISNFLNSGLTFSSINNLRTQVRVEELKSHSLDFEFTTQYDQEDNAIFKTAPIVLDVYTPRIVNTSDMVLFAGVSAAHPSDLINYRSVMMAMSYGDIAYEEIKKNSVLANRSRVGFFTAKGHPDGEGIFYTGRPMIGTDGQYYTTDTFDVEAVKRGLDDLQARYAPQAAANSDLNTILGNVDYIYTKYGATPKYLLELNAYRKGIKVQDINQDIGKYYESFSVLINNTMVALARDGEIVEKRITYSSKLRDWRPSQWAPTTTATYNPSLDDDDFLYNVIIQTNLSKYVEARDDENPDSINPMFEPESPYTAQEMRESYYIAIHDKLKRFYSEYTERTFGSISGYGSHGTDADMVLRAYAVQAGYDDSPLGMDNISQFLEVNTRHLIDKAVFRFAVAYEAMAQWIDGESHGQRIYLGGWGGGENRRPEDSDFVEHMIAEYGEEWEENLGLYGLRPGDLDRQQNYKAFNSAFMIFGAKGNPSNRCTLEFGYDTTTSGPDSSGNYTCSPTLGQHVGLDDRYSPPLSIPYVESTPVSSYTSNGFQGYKCFNQLRPFINVIGTGESDVRERTYDGDGDTSEHRYGWFRWYESYNEGPSDWNLKDSIFFGAIIRDFLQADTYLVRPPSSLEETYADGPDAGAKAIFDTVLTTYLGVETLNGSSTGHQDSFFLRMLADPDLWNNANSEWGMAEVDGTLINSNINAYAEDFADRIETFVYLFLDGLANNAKAKTYRLRWCPEDSGNTAYDANSRSDNNPYGGLWQHTFEPAYKKAPNGQRWDDRDVPLPGDIDGAAANVYAASPYTPHWYSGGFYNDDDDTLKLANSTAGSQEAYEVLLGVGAQFVSNYSFQRPSWSRYQAGTWRKDPQFAIKPVHLHEDMLATIFGQKISPGRFAFNPASDTIMLVKTYWQSVWRPDVVDMVKEVIPLIAEYHGVSMSAALQNKLAHVDIVSEKYGWFFFDMEKYLMKQSNLSQYVNPRAIEKFFTYGRSMLNLTCKIDEVDFHRWDGIPDGASVPSDDAEETALNDGSHVRMTLNTDSSYRGQPDAPISLKFRGWSNKAASPGGLSLLTTLATDIPFPYIPQADVAGWRDLTNKGGEGLRTDAGDAIDFAPGPTEAVDSYNQWSYLMQRNYDFAGTSLVPNDYRMACFAFNYYVDDDVALRAGDAYQIKVKIRDSSQKIFETIKTYTGEIQNAYAAYAEKARENCAYNHFDSTFNQFFVDAMDEQYGENQARSPWQRLAVAIPILEDVIYARYGGELSVIFEMANSISDSINPYTGTLDKVDHYLWYYIELRENINTIYYQIMEDHYDVISGDYVQKETSKYKTLVLGNSVNDYSIKRDYVFVNRGIVDYSSDRTSEFPELPIQGDIGQDDLGEDKFA